MTTRRDGPAIPRREIVTLFAYLQAGSHRAGAHRLGISESTSRQRTSSLLGRLEVAAVAQAVWVLRRELEVEAEADRRRQAAPTGWGLQDGRPDS